jgi:hypothetical protein
MSKLDFMKGIGMSNGTLAKITAKTAADVCNNFPLSDEAKPLLRDGMTPKQFLDTLLEKKQFQTAITFLAHALPKREAIWWGLQCARGAAGANPPPKIAGALQASEKWVTNPCEDFRRPAMPASEAAEMSTAAGCLAAAVSWTGGSLGPPNVPSIPPGEFLPARGVVGAVMLAAVADIPKLEETYQKFLNLGIEVANGTNRWK